MVKPNLLQMHSSYVVTDSKGSVTYTKKSGNKNITINKKTGNITIAKGLTRGTYKIKEKLKAAGNSNYKSSTKTATIKIIVK